MERVEQILNGRKYQAIADENGHSIVLGPPEGLVDDLGLPEPFATNLHNVLYERGLWNYKAIMANPRNLQGALQEALQFDVQRLTEAYFKYENQEVEHDHQ